jgi:GNAT superfamily N-acetyltransferase
MTDAPPRPAVQIEALDLRRRGDRRRFIAVEAAAYGCSSAWIRPLLRDQDFELDPARNELLTDRAVAAFVARRDGRDQGRVLAHRHAPSGQGAFGFWVSGGDAAVSAALLGAARRFLASQGCAQMAGPLSYTLDQPAGLLVSGEPEARLVGVAYSPPGEAALLEQAGLHPHQELYAWRWSLRQQWGDPRTVRLLATADRARERGGLQVRAMAPGRFEDELVSWHTLLNRARRAHPLGRPPLSHRDMSAWAHELARTGRDELFLFVERDGELVGASAAVPDTGPLLPPSGRLLPFAWARLLWGRGRLDEARLASLVVDPDLVDLPVGAVLLAETARRALAIGIHTLHLSGALAEDPLVPALARDVGAPRSLHHRVYAGSTVPPPSSAEGDPR